MMKKLIALLFITFSGLNLLAQSPYSRIAFKASPQEMKMLHSNGIALDHLQLTENGYAGEFSARETSLILGLLSDAEIIVPDVQKYYRQQSKGGNRTASTPALFRYGQMGGYLYLAEMNALIDTMIIQYPNLISIKDTIGYSIEGRPICALRMSDNPNSKETETEVLYTALHHAREPMSLMQMIYYMAYLLEEYGTNAEITQILNNCELYFIPCINPDGYVYNATTDSAGGGMWRKNRRDNGDGSFGVDLNRNYDYTWGMDDWGSSPFPEDEVYRGEFPFSEPETQAVRDFCIAHHFEAALNYHSFGNKLVFPWGYGYDELTPDSVEYQEFADLLTIENGYWAGTANQTVGYTVNGDSDDWFYGETSSKNKIFAFTPEVGEDVDFFWPPQSQIIPYCEDNLRQNINLAKIGMGLSAAVAPVPGQIQVKVWPNPGNGLFQLAGLPEHVDMTIYSANGALIYSGSGQETIDLRHLPEGLYLLRVHTSSAVQMLKLISAGNR